LLSRTVACREIIGCHHRCALCLGFRGLQQLQVELLLELAAELRALAPPDFGGDQAAGGEVELDLGADRKLLAAFDQSAAARDVAEPRALYLPLVMEQRGANDAH